MAEREMQTAQHRPGKEQDQRGQTDPAQFGAGEKIHVVNVGRSTGVAPGHTRSLRIAIGVSGDDILVCAHAHRMIRSEEHTSELQSLMRISYAVFCLKKTTAKKQQ